MKPILSTALACTLAAMAARQAIACDLKVEGPWIRQPTPGATTAAAYGSFRNTGKAPIEITSVALPGGGMAMMHESVMKDGVMEMPHLGKLAIAPGASVAFAPMGKHIMLMDLPAMPKVGTKLKIELVDSAGCKSVVEFPVLPLGQDGPASSGGHEHHSM